MQPRPEATVDLKQRIAAVSIQQAELTELAHNGQQRRSFQWIVSAHAVQQRGQFVTHPPSLINIFRTG